MGGNVCEVCHKVAEHVEAEHALAALGEESESPPRGGIALRYADKSGSFFTVQ
jgi:hypothetical protein